MAFVKQKILQKNELMNVKWQKEKFIKSLLTQAKKNQTQKTIKKLMSEMMSWLLLLNVAGVKKRRGLRAIDGFRKKLMIQDSEIPKSSEFEVKSKIGKLFQYQNPLQEYSVRIYEIDPYFYERYEKKYKLTKWV